LGHVQILGCVSHIFYCHITELRVLSLIASPVNTPVDSFASL